MRGALEITLERDSDDLETLLNDSPIYKTPLVECRYPIISDAHKASTEKDPTESTRRKRNL